MEDKAVQRNTLSAEKIVIMLGFYSKTERNLLQIVGFVLIYLFSLQISLSSPYEIHTIMEEKMQNESVYIYIPQTGVNDLAIANELKKIPTIWYFQLVDIEKLKP